MNKLPSITLAAILLAPVASLHAAEVANLRCEYLKDPLGIDAPTPRLSWVLEDRGQRTEVRGQMQTAYQVLVASSEELLKKDKGDLWDSGKVESDQSVNVEYQGKSLTSGMRCFWKVRVWSQTSDLRPPTSSSWSEPALWTMGALDPADWQAKWIRASEEDVNVAPWLRKSFDLTAVPVRASVCVNIAGYAELYVNGQKVGADVLTPAVSDHNIQVFYNTYDVTPLLKKGRNTIGLWLGRGWVAGVPLVRAELRAEVDGKPWFLGTDASWKARVSHYRWIGGRKWGNFGGERVDANAAVPDWSRETFDDSSWTNAVETSAPKGEAVAQQAPLNRIGKEIPAVAVTDIGGGKMEIDFGTALTGWLRLKMPVWNVDAEPSEAAKQAGPANLTIIQATYTARDGSGSVDVTPKVASLVKDDTLNFEVTPNTLGGDPALNHVKDLVVEYELHGTRRTTRAVDFSPLTITVQPKRAMVRMTFADVRQKDGNYQHFNQVSEFISAGGVGEVFQNKFNYAGFRYVIVEGLPSPPAKEDAVALLVESDLETVGSFECSNELFNRIHRVNQWTQRCLNLGGYYVDCPHRERMGYGDGQVATEGFMTSFNAYGYYRKWLCDWRLRQGADGGLPHMAPFGAGGGGPGWPGLLAATTWRHYLYYGDRRVLEENFDAIRRYVDHLEARCTDNILKKYGGQWDFIGDWVPPNRGMDTKNWPGPQAAELFNNCYRIYQMDLLMRMAEALGKKDEVARCQSRMAVIRPAVHAAFYDKAAGHYVIDEQAYYVMPLMTGVVPEPERAAMLKKLEQNILVKNQGHLDTGMLGTYFMMEYLRETDRNDLVFTMFNQTTHPGWGYMLEQGATTLWEQWNGYYSHIHSCFTSPDNWFYQGLGGIMPDFAAPGFKNIIIKPALAGDPFPPGSSGAASVTWVKCHHDSPYGRIVSNWKLETGNLKLDVTIPANTTATVFVPAKDAARVTEGGSPIDKVKGVRFLRMENNAAVYAVGSGNYQFQSTTTEGAKRKTKGKEEQMSKTAGNPILPGVGLCDPHIRIYNDHAYLYATHDKGPDYKGFTMDDWWIWSSPDLVCWKHECTIRPEQTYYGKPDRSCWAVDAMERDGKHYYYFSRGPKDIGVMAGETPVGPWRDPLGKPLLANGSVATDIRDPGLFKDDDGECYIVFGTWNFYIARLNPDMISLAETPRKINIINPEGPYGKGKTDDKPYLHKRGGIYYLSWGCYYGMSKSVYGDYECKGSIILEENVHQSLRYKHRHITQDRHGSFFEWRGQWYFICNEMGITQSDHFRDSSIMYVYYRANGEIEPVTITPEGVEPILRP